MGVVVLLRAVSSVWIHQGCSNLLWCPSHWLDCSGCHETAVVFFQRGLFVRRGGNGSETLPESAQSVPVGTGTVVMPR